MTSINCGLVAIGTKPTEAPGIGDYTKERHEIFDNMTNEEILTGIEKVQNYHRKLQEQRTHALKS